MSLRSGPPGVIAREISAAIRDARVFRLTIAATDVAVHWRGEPDAALTLAFGSDATHFGPAIAVEPDENGLATGGGESYGDVLWADGARFVRVTSDRPIARLTVVAFGSDGKITASAAADQPLLAIGQQPIVTRAAWGANEALRFDAAGHENWPAEFYPLQRIFVHHTAGRNGDPDPAATVRAIYHYHAIIRGWGDIGYNFLIDEAGRIYEGRHARTFAAGEPPTSEDPSGKTVRGAQVKDFNDGTMGISLLGTFTSQLPTPAALASLTRLLAWEAERHGLDPLGRSLYLNPFSGLSKTLDTISGHRDAGSTTCPGDQLYAYLPTIRHAVANLIAAARTPAADQVDPVVTSFAALAANPTGGSTIHFGLTFSEPVTGLTADDFSVSGSSPGWTVTSVSGSAAVYDVVASSAAPADGSVSLTLADHGVTDLVGHDGPAAETTADAAFAIDSAAPTVVVAATPAAAVTATTVFNVTFSFNEPVANFSAAQVLLGGTSQAATPWVIDRVFGSGANYNLGLTQAAPADGTLTIQLPAGLTADAAGNPSQPSDLLVLTIDRSSPVTSAPLAHLAGGTMSSSSLPASVTWSGTDRGSAGVATYDLARSVDGAAFVILASGLASPGARVRLAPGHSYRFEVRAHDRVGNVGAWVAGPTLQPGLTQQWSSGIFYHGTWRGVSGTSYTGGSDRYATAAGASAGYTFTGRSVAIVSSRAAGRGLVRVYIDGVLVSTVDLYAPSTAYRQVVFARTWGSSGTHTIRLVVAGTAGRPRVDLDAVEVLR